jgi:cation:H+ antiporter
MSAMVRPIVYDTAFNRDIYLLLVGTVLLFIFLYLGKRKLVKPAAALLVFTFVAYTLYLISLEI